MTKEFAIDYLLDDCQDCPENKDGECMTESHCFEVKQMAINALKQEPKTDAVSRNDVIKMLNTMDRYSADKLRLCDTNKEFPHNEVFIVDDMYEELDLLPLVRPQEPKTGHWIPVSERLPEKNMHCLVSVGKLYLTQIAIYSDLMGTIEHKIFYQGNYGYGDFNDITEYVKAWMPLPTPYKEESEES